jgi:nitroimidazol reductase NimA-like FMN-containing flavoprotein (pyridoxamine 5'-phosphate oxidase superfamily)
MMRRKDWEVTDINEIMSIIGKCRVCHLAMTDKGLPYIVPLSYGYMFNGNTLTLYFHSAAEGRKIDILKENSSVCFEMSCEGELGLFENPCNSGYYYESVIGSGRVDFVEDVDEKCMALSLLMKHQTKRDFVFNEKQANSVCVFKVVSTDFTGKKKPNPGVQPK